ncbi:RpiB/LacA/LacB family sugar-phosphate isomerase [Microbacterium sp. Bi121]|uniref:RpiB/LacA/LacB family sugar-phosphate isomerase n=1 Tax=Microbacterium sp. Bi121 TaxID=2822348 RepID=UPI001D704A1B|nr:RpiB/LacA/LacB family sugar-phosphate isomerase [Microbacterium sp. Bi121]CAH0148587.1 Putative sugar phosphate isomerase YwlF [Microbacterium sp. Bi121]
MAVIERIAITGDHHGTAVVDAFIDALTARGIAVTDLAPRGHGVIDYPPLCAAVGREITSGRADMGIVLGGSGQGEVIACNKIRGVRAGLAYSEFAVDISRGNNDANIMVVGTKVIDERHSLTLLERWLDTPFKGGVHAQRLAQIAAIEQEEWATH